MASDAEKVVLIKPVAEALGTTPSTIHRLIKRDPNFPRPFRLSPRGEWRWLESAVLAYRSGKTGPAAAA